MQVGCPLGGCEAPECTYLSNLPFVDLLPAGAQVRGRGRDDGGRHRQPHAWFRAREHPKKTGAGRGGERRASLAEHPPLLNG